jgi:phage shock protein A
MSIFTKLNTLLRAGARESAERITDANAIRIYRQEIVDAENLLERRRASLASLIATRKDMEREIASTRQRICTREEQIIAIAPEERSEELLMLGARDIAANEAHVAKLEKRRMGIEERINSEELTLRKLVTEIKEHRREIRILAAELSRNGKLTTRNCSSTVAGHLATLRATHEGIAGTLSHSDVAEESFVEASERVDGDPLDRELAAQGRDDASLRLANVLQRLKNMTGPIAQGS